MCAVLLYCRMFRLIWRDWAVRQKASGPRCMVTAAEKSQGGREVHTREFKMKPMKKVKGEAAGRGRATCVSECVRGLRVCMLSVSDIIKN